MEDKEIGEVGQRAIERKLVEECQYRSLLNKHAYLTHEIEKSYVRDIASYFPRTNPIFCFLSSRELLQTLYDGAAGFINLDRVASWPVIRKSGVVSPWCMHYIRCRWIKSIIHSMKKKKRRLSCFLMLQLFTFIFCF